ncbi:hypothetical protein [Methylosinus sp. PW1]|uniref:hypothetical protein n=1 Tax=Methylosinus sp. PW1 TaxID=107636 RepID=UPI00055CBFE1|nr:hypothetical protein [Methylosinus sp. PW1]
MTVELNPRWLAYCVSQGRSDAEQRAFDKERMPCGRMFGFISWSNRMIRDAAKSIPEAFIGGGLHDHDAYDDWLWRNVAPYWAA